MEIKAIYQIILLAGSGATGTLLRYFTYIWADQYLNKHLPWGTIIVNLVGSFSIGFVWGLMEKNLLSPSVSLIVLVGLLGSFTTFSTFALDNFKLLNNSTLTHFLFYYSIQNIGGIVLCVVGIFMARLF